MKRLLLLSTLLLAFCFHAQAWDVGANREKKGRQSNWKWRIYTNGWNGYYGPGPSYLFYVYDAGGGRNLSGNVDLAWDLWDRSTHNLDTNQWAYFWFGYPYIGLADGLFKDTGITGVTNMNFTYSSPMIVGGAFTPINIQTIGTECFRNSSIQGEVFNYTPASVHMLGPLAFAGCRSLSGNLVTPQNVTVIQNGTYMDCSGITGYCHIQDVVTSIGFDAFARNENMSGWLHLPNNLQSIGTNAFISCKRLTGNLNIPDGVHTIAQGAFFDCQSFNGWLHLPANCATISDYAFTNCHSLTGNLEIRQAVQTIGVEAFKDCYSMNGILWWQGCNPWYIGARAFYNCSRLTGGLIIPHSVTNMGDQAFAYCSGFNGTLQIPNSLPAIPFQAFNRCQNLVGDIIIPQATSIGQEAFADCHSFNGRLQLPNNLQIIGNWAFWNCNKLQGDLNIPSATTIGQGAFRQCSGFNGRLYLPANLQAINDEAFWDCQKLSGDLVFPNGLQSIGKEAFVRCYNFTGNVTIPASVTNVGYHTFWECVGLESFTFAPGSQLATLGNGAWSHCIGLKYIDMLNCQPLAAATIMRGNSDNSPFSSMRPYTIVYLPNGTAASKIPADQENFVVDGNCANFKVYDTHSDYKGNRGCDYYIKHAFTAAKANYTRTFSGKDAATLFLPYPTTLPAGMTAYELKNMKRAGGKSIFVFAPLPSSATLEANKAYVVRVTDGGSHNLPEMHNVIVPVTPALASTATLGTADNNWQFNGTTQFIPNATAASMKAYNLNVGNTWLPVTTANTNGHIHSFRAFLTSPTGTAPAKSFVMLLDDGPVITNIDSIRKGEADVQSGRYSFYSLDGHNLGRDYNRLPSGNIYIVNGKKFYKN